MSEIVLPISRCWKFERKTRDYRRSYRDVAIQIEKGEMKLEDVTYKALEKMQKTYKNHRCILEIDRSYITSTWDAESSTSSAVGDMEIVQLWSISVTVSVCYRWTLCMMMNKLGTLFKYLQKKNAFPPDIYSLFLSHRYKVNLK